MNKARSVLFGKLKMRALFALLLSLYSYGLLAQPSIDLSQTEQQSVSPLLSGLSPVTEAMLAAPPSEDWLIWRRDHHSLGYSPLDQINRETVSQLQESWRRPLQVGPNMATPLVHDGVMFLLDREDTVLALDASNGNQLWSYQHDTARRPGLKMGLAIYGDKLLVPTSGTRLIALNTSTGELAWEHKIDFTDVGETSQSLRGAPLVAGGQVIQGVTASSAAGGGLILAIDIDTGEETWRFHTTARPSEFGGNTWNEMSVAERSGGSVWLPGSYDAELDLVYFGVAPTYNTKPLYDDIETPGISNDALFTNSTVALRPSTGELVWHYQHIANDQWDLDWAYERQLLNLDVGGVMRKVVLTAGKMALYDALDAATGEYLFSIDLGAQNLVESIDPETGIKALSANGRPYAEISLLVCPYAIGGRNWPSASLNTESSMLFLPLSEFCMISGPTGQTEGPYVNLLSTQTPLYPAQKPDSDGKFGRLQAVDLETRELSWSFREVSPPTSAALATAGGIVFLGSLDQSFKAFDDRNGEVLWQTDLGDVPAAFPITYSVEGKQHIAVIVGQPTLHANLLMGALYEFLGVEQNPLLELSQTGPALVVLALE